MMILSFVSFPLIPNELGRNRLGSNGGTVSLSAAKHAMENEKSSIKNSQTSNRCFFASSSVCDGLSTIFIWLYCDCEIIIFHYSCHRSLGDFNFEAHSWIFIKILCPGGWQSLFSWKLKRNENVDGGNLINFNDNDTELNSSRFSRISAPSNNFEMQDKQDVPIKIITWIIKQRGS